MNYVNDVYFDFAKSIKRRLNEEINARIIFEIYDDIDTIIFKLYFKDFEFKYALNDIQTIIYTGRTNEIVTDMLSAYKGCILNSFFKSKARKERDKTRRIMGRFDEMINVDLRRYGTDEEYRQFINGYISGADIDEAPIECQLVRSVKEATDEEIQEILGKENDKHGCRKIRTGKT